MKRFAIVLLCSACTIAPKLVTVPMGEASPVTPITVDPSSETPDDVEDPSTADDFSGSWGGTAWHVGNKTWPMTVTFEKHGAHQMIGHVYYSDRRCRADWTLHTGSSKHWEGSESVKIDPFNGCPNNAQIFIDVIEEDTVRWRWVGAGGSASATLQRTQH